MKNRPPFEVRFAKDRQKFSAAHFTLFPDGSAERLHGHNYLVEAAFVGEVGVCGLVFPFHEAKAMLTALCNSWDERVLLPGKSPWLTITSGGTQIEARLTTPKIGKFYSFPAEDVVLLDCDNVSCENLTALLTDRLAAEVETRGWPLRSVELRLFESSGQSVLLRRDLPFG